MAAPEPHRTFRDPAGSLELQPHGALRTIAASHAGPMLAFLEGSTAARLAAEGRLIASEVLEHGPDLRLMHPRVEFISYPWEWSPFQWLKAADLTLDLCLELLAEDRLLKDATPLNILFQGARPVLVDVLSIEPVDLSRPVWLAYGQFVRTFLLPMLAHTRLGWPLHATLMRRDGFEPEEIYRALPLAGRLRAPAFTSVTLPTLLSKRSNGGAATVQRSTDPELTRHVLRRTLLGLKRKMHAVAPAQTDSAWSGYAGAGCHYQDADHTAKREFVTAVLQNGPALRVLDVGANTGEYSRIATDGGASVVAIEADEQAADRLARMAWEENRNILTLHMDLAHPSPAVGWRNAECASFLSRAEGHFDTVLMLAVIHHLLLSAQVPLDRIATLAADLTTRDLVIEWVPFEDPKFQEILRGRDDLYRHLTEEAFRSAFQRHFRVVRELRLTNGRTLFHLAKGDA